MNMCIFMSESNFVEDGFYSNVLIEILDTQQDSSHKLDLQSMRKSQLNDDSLITMVEERITGRILSYTNYTYKSVEGIELIHKNNRILVPKSKQQNVLD